MSRWLAITVLLCLASPAGAGQIEDDLDHALKNMPRPSTPLGDWGNGWYAPLREIPKNHIHAEVEIPVLTVRGPLEEDSAREELAKHVKWFRYCLEAAALDKPNLPAGKVVLNVVIDKSGHVNDTAHVLYKSTILSYTFERCIKSSPEEWRFAEHGEPTSLTVTVAFVPKRIDVLDSRTHIDTKTNLFSDEPGHLKDGDKSGMVKLRIGGFAESNIVEQIVRIHLLSIKYCFVKEKIVSPATSSTTVVIGAERMKVTDIKFSNETTDGEGADCIRRMIERWKFPNGFSDKGTVTFEYVPPRP